MNTGDVMTIKSQSTLAKALIAYHRTPSGRRLIHPWMMSKAMIRTPYHKPQVMTVMLFADGIFKDKLAPVNFFMWMLTDYGVD